MICKKHCAGILFISLGILSSCFGSGLSCDTSTNNSVAAAGSAIAGQPIAADPGAPNASDSFAALGANGCFTVDVQFSSFAVTSGGSGTTPLNYVSTLTNQDLTLTNPVTAVISSIRGTESGVNNPDGQQDDSLNNFVAATSGTTTVNNQYEFAESSGSPVKYFTLNLLGEQLGTGATAGTITGNVFLCLGGTFTGSTSGTCSGGTLQTILLNSATSYAVTLTTPETTFGILNNFTLKGGTTAGNNGATFVTSFEETFADSPEPSTFLLMGSALAGIAALQFRKRKQQS
jgi:hypothetical protein